MDAWQSHCPRFTLWEDALDEQLVELELGSATVTLTARGRAALDGRSQRERELRVLGHPAPAAE